MTGTKLLLEQLEKKNKIATEVVNKEQGRTIGGGEEEEQIATQSWRHCRKMGEAMDRCGIYQHITGRMEKG